MTVHLQGSHVSVAIILNVSHNYYRIHHLKYSIIK